MHRQEYNFCSHQERRMKNGKTLDSAWLHGTTVVQGNFRQVRCNYCSKVLNSCITGLKKHLARIDVDVKPCPSVPQAVSDGFRENFEERGPNKILTLKRNQKKVPLCEGPIDDGITEKPEIRMKNGRALDSAWLHGTTVVEGDFTQVRCNYCQKVIISNITGLKKHLARIGVGVTACPSVPQAVSDGFRENFEESGPNKIWTLKRYQKTVPLCAGQCGNPTNVNTDDGAPEEYGEHSANDGPTLLVTKCQSSPSNSGHTALMKGMSSSIGKKGKEVAQRVAERLNVNFTEGYRSQVRTHPYSAQISSDSTPVIIGVDSSSDDEAGPYTSLTDSRVRIHKHSAYMSSDSTPIINVEDSSSDDETGPRTNLTDTSSKKRRVDDAFGPHQGLRSSDT